MEPHWVNVDDGALTGHIRAVDGRFRARASSDSTRLFGNSNPSWAVEVAAQPSAWRRRAGSLRRALGREGPSFGLPRLPADELGAAIARLPVRPELAERCGRVREASMPHVCNATGLGMIATASGFRSGESPSPTSRVPLPRARDGMLPLGTLSISFRSGRGELPPRNLSSCALRATTKKISDVHFGIASDLFELGNFRSQNLDASHDSTANPIFQTFAIRTAVPRPTV